MKGFRVCAIKIKIGYSYSIADSQFHGQGHVSNASCCRFTYLRGAVRKLKDKIEIHGRENSSAGHFSNQLSYVPARFVTNN